MINDFYPVITNDGSVSLFNNSVDDIYHSSVGAYTEALNKFVIPSGILKFVENNNTVRLLDICYGLGYNSKVAVNEILKVNSDCKIYVDCLEIDENVLALSSLIKSGPIEDYVDLIFANSLLKNKKIKMIANNYINDKNFLTYISPILSKFLKSKIKKGVTYIKRPNLNRSIHNIYYRTLSNRNKNTPNDPLLGFNVEVDFYSDDARKSINKLKGNYNYVFHDGFTPSKLPTLWTVEFFNRLTPLLDDNAILVTYSSSAAMRGSLIEAGYDLGSAFILNNKPRGTIAALNSSLISNKLSKKEIGLLESRAGIPYRDKCFTSTSQEIIEIRKNEMSVSSRISSSKFLKQLKTEQKYI